MLSYEEAGNVLDAIAEELPEQVFDKLNGGVALLEESKTAEDGRYTLGTYFVNGMGRYIELYYGSFIELYGDMDDELFGQRLKKTLQHELTHHIESLAGDRSLERWDERQAELMGFNGIDVHSILFVDDDNSLSLAAEHIFNKNKSETCPDVQAGSAGIADVTEPLNRGFVKAMQNLEHYLPETKRRAINEELIELHDVILCMTIDQADKLSVKYQKYEERIMCLAETDITPPMLAIGWKKCISELQDEVFAVIDEIGQENF